MDFKEIQEIIRMVSKHNLSEFMLKQGDFKLVVRNQGHGVESHSVTPGHIQAPQAIMAAPQTPVAAPPSAATAPKAEAVAPSANEDGNFVMIKSPMVGTFYRSSAPDKPPFVKVGDIIEVGQQVCVIEAMKLFNEIESDVKGKVVKILVDDASPVEYEKPLFLVDPS